MHLTIQFTHLPFTKASSEVVSVETWLLFKLRLKTFVCLCFLLNQGITDLLYFPLVFLKFLSKCQTT